MRHGYLVERLIDHTFLITIIDSSGMSIGWTSQPILADLFVTERAAVDTAARLVEERGFDPMELEIRERAFHDPEPEDTDKTPVRSWQQVQEEAQARGAERAELRKQQTVTLIEKPKV